MTTTPNSRAWRSTRLLLVEDEPNIAIGVTYNLEKDGYSVEHANRGDRGLELALAKDFDLILLDVMLPGLNGFEICDRLRTRGVRAPILMLTARGETESRVKGIELGADDYLPKPFALEELLARVRALLRRQAWQHEPRARSTRLSLGSGIELDAERFELKNATQSIELTPIECRLLQLLIGERDVAVPRAKILKKVWGLHEDTQTRTLDNFIMRLRHHLQRLGGAPDWIESVRGVGYRFTGPNFDKSVT